MTAEVMAAFQEFVEKLRGDGVIPVVVTSVDHQEYLFDAKDGAGNEYLDIRVNATPGTEGVLELPTPNSSVLITDMGNQAQVWVMVASGQLDEYLVWLSDRQRIRITMDGVEIGGSDQQLEAAVVGDSLNRNIGSLITELQNLVIALSTFSTANGAASAAGPLAPLAPAYASLNANLSTLAPKLTQLQQSLTRHLSTNVKISR